MESIRKYPKIMLKITWMMNIHEWGTHGLESCRNVSIDGIGYADPKSGDRIQKGPWKAQKISMILNDPKRNAGMKNTDIV